MPLLLFFTVTLLLANQINRRVNNFCLTKNDVTFLYKNISFLLRLALLLIVVAKTKMFKLLFVFLSNCVPALRFTNFAAIVICTCT